MRKVYAVILLIPVLTLFAGSVTLASSCAKMAAGYEQMATAPQKCAMLHPIKDARDAWAVADKSAIRVKRVKVNRRERTAAAVVWIALCVAWLLLSLSSGGRLPGR
jgi:hypothetical protein